MHLILNSWDYSRVYCFFFFSFQEHVLPKEFHFKTMFSVTWRCDKELRSSPSLSVVKEESGEGEGTENSLCFLLAAIK